MVVVDCWDRFCTLGRAPRTKETLPDFHEWCRVTRHPRIFRGLTGCQQTPRFGASQLGIRARVNDYPVSSGLGIHKFSPDTSFTAWYQILGKRLPWELGGCVYKYGSDNSFTAWYQSLGIRIPRAWGT